MDSRQEFANWLKAAEDKKHKKEQAHQMRHYKDTKMMRHPLPQRQTYIPNPKQLYQQYTKPTQQNQNNFTVTPHQGNLQNKVIEENINLGIPKLERLTTQMRSVCINIDSRDRNRDKYPNTNNFRVHTNSNDGFVGASLETSDLKNIHSIKLAEAILPDFTGEQAYLILVIPELQDTMIGTNDKLRKAFAILVPDNVNVNFVTTKARNSCYCYKEFNPPLASLNSLTFEFYNPDGTLHDFGIDNLPPNPVNNEVQVMVSFEVSTIDVNKNVLQSRPLY